MKIVKIINNNTVCAVDEKGKERIVSGKGIGFGKKRGEAIDPAQIQKIYMITDSVRTHPADFGAGGLYFQPDFRDIE